MIARASNKRDAVLADLRQKIVAGIHRPGDRLPTRTEMLQTYGVSTITLQQALDTLMRDGFVVTHGPLGTFVADNPPHLFHYGLVFPSDPSGGEEGFWLPAWRALLEEARRVTGGRKISIYFNVNRHTDVEDYQRLLRDIRHQRLAGLVYTHVPRPMLGDLLAGYPALPGVSLCGEPIESVSYSIGCDEESAVNKTLDYLVSRGRRQIAVIDMDGAPGNKERITAAMRLRGLQVRPYWFHEIDHRNAIPARRVADLLMRGTPEARPDGLYVVQQFLAEQATAGIADAGLRAPQDIDVVAGCNFPWTSPTCMPVKWIGKDIGRELQTAMDVIDQARAGQSPSAVRMFPALFEEEVPARKHIVRDSTGPMPARALAG